MAATRRVRPVSHDDRLSLVEHLDELRSRLMTCAVVLVIAFAFALWQQTALLGVLNEPIEKTTTTTGKGPLEQNARFQREVGIALQSTAASLNALAAQERPSPERARLEAS